LLVDLDSAAGHRHGDDLLRKPPLRDRLLRPRQRGDGIGILHFAGELIGLGAILGKRTHQPALVIGVFETVEKHVVEDAAMAEPVAATSAVEQIGRVGHAFHAAGQRHADTAGNDGVMGEHDGLHAGAAHLVDGNSADGLGNAGPHGGLTRRRLPLPRRQHAAEQHLVDIAGCDPGALHRAARGNGAEGRRRHGFEVALETAHRRAGKTDDDHRIMHSHFPPPWPPSRKEKPAFASRPSRPGAQSAHRVWIERSATPCVSGTIPPSKTQFKSILI